MELFESVIAPAYLKEVDANCPFQQPPVPEISEDPEDIADDDRDDLAVQAMQENDGGTLGKNLVAGSPGADGTWQKASPPLEFEEPQVDSKHPPKESPAELERIEVDGTPQYYTVAAHHLIPGNAALYNKDSKIKSYMIKEKTVKVVTDVGGTKDFTIKAHIGYNVNGAHNGVWLPGNYAMNRPRVVERNQKFGTSEIAWTKQEEEWQRKYVVAAVKHKKAQFHDTHGGYSNEVLQCLNDMCKALRAHQADCKREPCASAKAEIPPPYMLIKHLNNLSKHLRTTVTASNPLDWELPFVTSEHWQKELVDETRKREYLAAWYGEI